MSELQTNQVTEVKEVWYKKWGKYILMGLLAVLTLGAYAYAARSKNPTDTTDKLDEIDRDIIENKIVDANTVGKEIEAEQTDMQQIKVEGQAAFDSVADQAVNKTDDQKIADFNESMKKRR
jgi:hypothetical protein